MDPLTNDGPPGAFSTFPRLAPVWCPTSEDFFHAGMGSMKHCDCHVTFDDPRRPLGRCWDHLVTMGVNGSTNKAMGSHAELTRPLALVLIGPKSVVCGLFAPWWTKLGWPTAATMHQFKPKPPSTFLFYMDALTNNDGPGCYVYFSMISLSMGPY